MARLDLIATQTFADNVLRVVWTVSAVEDLPAAVFLMLRRKLPFGYEDQFIRFCTRSDMQHPTTYGNTSVYWRSTTATVEFDSLADAERHVAIVRAAAAATVAGWESGLDTWEGVTTTPVGD